MGPRTGRNAPGWAGSGEEFLDAAAGVLARLSGPTRHAPGHWCAGALGDRCTARVVRER